MPALPNERQYRSVTAALAPTERDSRLIDSECYVEGYATTFNDPYALWVDMDGTEYREQVDPSAFEGADMSDVIMQYDHEGKVLARLSNGSLVLKPDDHGLLVGADLSGSQASRALYEEIKSGLVTKMSWGFSIAEQEYDRSANLATIKRVAKVYDVSAVSLPADPNTEISARRALDGEIEARRKELARRRAALAKAKAVIAINQRG